MRSVYVRIRDIMDHGQNGPRPKRTMARTKRTMLMVTGRFGPIPVRTPGRFGPIPFRSGRFGLGRFGPILEVGRFGPILVGRFGPLYFI